MLQIKSKQGEYPKNGVVMFVYAVQSTADTPEKQAEELAAYKTGQGQYYRENAQGEPLYWSQEICQPGAQLVKRTNGRFGVNQDLEQRVEQERYFQVKRTGELAADAQFMGITRSTMRQMLMSKYAS